MTDKKELAEQIKRKAAAISKMFFRFDECGTRPYEALVQMGTETAAIIEAMSINSENVYTKNPCDENVNMSDTRNDAQRYTAD